MSQPYSSIIPYWNKNVIFQKKFFIDKPPAIIRSISVIIALVESIMVIKASTRKASGYFGQLGAPYHSSGYSKPDREIAIKVIPSTYHGEDGGKTIYIEEATRLTVGNRHLRLNYLLVCAHAGGGLVSRSLHVGAQPGAHPHAPADR